MKICTVNDITSINFYLANDHQIENYSISFEYGAEKFQSKTHDEQPHLSQHL